MSADFRTSMPAAGDQENGGQAQRKQGRGMLWIVIAIVVLGLALLAGLLPHFTRSREVDAMAQQQKNALPVVEVQTVHIASSDQELNLPGTVVPLRSAHIYARASGYLKARYVDLGDTVRKGQLLAVISAPDLDASVEQQAAAVQQSKDNVLTAQSALQLQQATYTRVHTLVLHGILSQQEDDAAHAAVESAQSNLQAMENAVKGAQGGLTRAQVLAEFEQVRLTDRPLPEASARRALLLGRDDMAFDSGLEAHLRSEGVAVTAIPGPGSCSGTRRPIASCTIASRRRLTRFSPRISRPPNTCGSAGCSQRGRRRRISRRTSSTSSAS